jgi:4'-phosphopantetheinyl transferase EntD
MKLELEIQIIEGFLKQWFLDAFIQGAPIAAYPILPEEESFISKAVQRRRNEFSTGRWLSRRGLHFFGFENYPVKIGLLREPVWPDSILGSISHDGEVCTVVLARKDLHGICGIGVDLVEISSRLKNMSDLTSIFMTSQSELEAMNSINISIDPAVLLFSIKESVIKALRYKLDSFIDMRDIEIYKSGRLQYKLRENSIRGNIFVAKTNNYLLTAANALI